MPIGKVDSKSFQTAQQANPFLRLSVPGAAAAATAGGGGGGPHSPTSGRDSTDGAESAAAELWRELGGSQDTVSRCVYMCVCVLCLPSGMVITCLFCGKHVHCHHCQQPGVYKLIQHSHCVHGMVCHGVLQILAVALLCIL